MVEGSTPTTFIYVKDSTNTEQEEQNLAQLEIEEETDEQQTNQPEDNDVTNQDELDELTDLLDGVNLNEGQHLPPNESEKEDDNNLINIPSEPVHDPSLLLELQNIEKNALNGNENKETEDDLSSTEVPINFSTELESEEEDVFTPSTEVIQENSLEEENTEDNVTPDEYNAFVENEKETNDGRDTSPNTVDKKNDVTEELEMDLEEEQDDASSNKPTNEGENDDDADDTNDSENEDEDNLDEAGTTMEDKDISDIAAEATKNTEIALLNLTDGDTRAAFKNDDNDEGNNALQRIDFLTKEDKSSKTLSERENDDTTEEIVTNAYDDKNEPRGDVDQVPANVQDTITLIIPETDNAVLDLASDEKFVKSDDNDYDDDDDEEGLDEVTTTGNAPVEDITDGEKVTETMTDDLENANDGATDAQEINEIMADDLDNEDNDDATNAQEINEIMTDDLENDDDDATDAQDITEIMIDDLENDDDDDATNAQDITEIMIDDLENDDDDATNAQDITEIMTDDLENDDVVATNAQEITEIMTDDLENDDDDATNAQDITEIMTDDLENDDDDDATDAQEITEIMTDDLENDDDDAADAQGIPEIMTDDLENDDATDAQEITEIMTDDLENDEDDATDAQDITEIMIDDLENADDGDATNAQEITETMTDDLENEEDDDATDIQEITEIVTDDLENEENDAATDAQEINEIMTDDLENDDATNAQEITETMPDDLENADDGDATNAQDITEIMTDDLDNDDVVATNAQEITEIVTDDLENEEEDDATNAHEITEIMTDVLENDDDDATGAQEISETMTDDLENDDDDDATNAQDITEIMIDDLENDDDDDAINAQDITEIMTDDLDNDDDDATNAQDITEILTDDLENDDDDATNAQDITEIMTDDLENDDDDATDAQDITEIMTDDLENEEDDDATDAQDITEIMIDDLENEEDDDATDAQDITEIMTDDLENDDDDATDAQDITEILTDDLENDDDDATDAQEITEIMTDDLENDDDDATNAQDITEIVIDDLENDDATNAQEITEIMIDDLENDDVDATNAQEITEIMTDDLENEEDDGATEAEPMKINDLAYDDESPNDVESNDVTLNRDDEIDEEESHVLSNKSEIFSDEEENDKSSEELQDIVDEVDENALNAVADEISALEGIEDIVDENAEIEQEDMNNLLSLTEVIFGDLDSLSERGIIEGKKEEKKKIGNEISYSSELLETGPEDLMDDDEVLDAWPISSTSDNDDSLFSHKLDNNFDKIDDDNLMYQDDNTLESPFESIWDNFQGDSIPAYDDESKDDDTTSIRLKKTQTLDTNSLPDTSFEYFLNNLLGENDYVDTPPHDADRFEPLEIFNRQDFDQMFFSLVAEKNDSSEPQSITPSPSVEKPQSIMAENAGNHTSESNEDKQPLEGKIQVVSELSGEQNKYNKTLTDEKPLETSDLEKNNEESFSPEEETDETQTSPGIQSIDFINPANLQPYIQVQDNPMFFKPSMLMSMVSDADEEPFQNKPNRNNQDSFSFFTNDYLSTNTDDFNIFFSLLSDQNVPKNIEPAAMGSEQENLGEYEENSNSLPLFLSLDDNEDPSREVIHPMEQSVPRNKLSLELLRWSIDMNVDGSRDNDISNFLQHYFPFLNPNRNSLDSDDDSEEFELSGSKENQISDDVNENETINDHASEADYEDLMDQYENYSENGTTAIVPSEVFNEETDAATEDSDVDSAFESNREAQEQDMEHGDDKMVTIPIEEHVDKVNELYSYINTFLVAVGICFGFILLLAIILMVRKSRKSRVPVMVTKDLQYKHMDENDQKETLNQQKLPEKGSINAFFIDV